MFATIGGTLGTVLTWPFVAYLMTELGWVYTFYIPATIVLAVTILWISTVYNSPIEHPRISEQELKFIEVSQGNSVSRTQRGMPPIECILKSPPFWALFFLHFGHLWSFYFFLVAAPKYLNEVLKFDLTESGILASAPYLSRFICGFLFGLLSDYFIKHDILSVTSIRKYFSIFCKWFFSAHFYLKNTNNNNEEGIFVSAHIIPGILLFSLRFVGDNPMYCVALITIALGLNGASTVVSLANAIDLAPNYAASLSSIIGTFSTSAGIIAPLVVSYFTSEHVSWHFSIQLN